MSSRTSPIRRLKLSRIYSRYTSRISKTPMVPSMSYVNTVPKILSSKEDIEHSQKYIEKRYSMQVGMTKS